MVSRQAGRFHMQMMGQGHHNGIQVRRTRNDAPPIRARDGIAAGGLLARPFRIRIRHGHDPDILQIPEARDVPGPCLAGAQNAYLQCHARYPM